MSKIKLLYDVARAMRKLDKIDGLLQLNVRKDQQEIFSLRNKFEKDAGGKGKATVSSELNLEGNHVKRESTTEFNLSGRCHHGPSMMRRMFHHHHESAGCCGIKGVFTKLSMAFGLLSSLKVEDKENGAAVVSLNLNDVPDELRAMLQEKMQERKECFSHSGLKECHEIETLNGVLVMTVNKDRVIEALSINLDGSVLDEKSASHPMAALAEVQLTAC
jgi:hypothetical protein